MSAFLSLCTGMGLMIDVMDGTNILYIASSFSTCSIRVCYKLLKYGQRSLAVL